LHNDAADGADHFGGHVFDIFSRTEAAATRCEGCGAAGFTTGLSAGSEALVALFEEAAFGEDFVGAPAFEFSDGFFVLDEGALVADGFGFELEFPAFEEAGDEFSDEFRRGRAAWEDIVNFDKVIDRVKFTEDGRNDFVGDDLLGIDGGFGVDVDFFQNLVFGVQVGESGNTTECRTSAKRYKDGAAFAEHFEAFEVFFVADTTGDEADGDAFFGGFTDIHEDLDVFDVDSVEDISECEVEIENGDFAT